MIKIPRCLIVYLLPVLLASISFCSRIYADVVPQLGKVPLAEVIATMTLEEKALLVVGIGMDLPPELVKRRTPEDEALFTDEKSKKVYTAYKTMVEKIKNLVPGAAGRTAEITRLGIPAMLKDAEAESLWEFLHIVEKWIPAAKFNPELVEKIDDELKNLNIHVAQGVTQ